MNKSDLQKLFSQTQKEFEQNWDGKKKLFKKLSEVEFEGFRPSWNLIKNFGYATALVLLLAIFSIRYLSRDLSISNSANDYYAFEDFEGIYEVVYTNQIDSNWEYEEYNEEELGESLDEIL